ncbi:Gibberellin 2-beta-dioxygenase 1 [Striga hermonthica]|uniref:Gibberellin 2-beta-dioxygenase 1 n=1 Tax=Striga hermonthica TaxID=68872 RepID=A0A9N7MVF2_STRHE|nr:Gibberellin 2-beta-dioxygenase 1 [Striga hermonthica]
MTCEILEMLADGLKIQPRNTFSKLLMDEESDSVFRLNHYPPRPDYSNSDERNLIGFGEHTDPQIISVLRSNNTSGLQISLKEGSWISVPADESSFFINVGDSLQYGGGSDPIGSGAPGCCYSEQCTVCHKKKKFNGGNYGFLGVNSDEAHEGLNIGTKMALGTGFANSGKQQGHVEIVAVHRKGCSMSSPVMMEHISGSVACDVCGEEESTLHVLRDCKVAKDLWTSLLRTAPVCDFYCLDLMEWLRHNLLMLRQGRQAN